MKKTILSRCGLRNVLPNPENHFSKTNRKRIQNRAKSTAAFLTVLCLCVSLLSTVCMAADREFAFSDLNTTLRINSDLYTVTRTTVSSDPALTILDVSVEELKVMLETNNVYLEAFPEDLSYEIVLSGGNAGSAKDFSDLTDEEILAAAKEDETSETSSQSASEENVKKDANGTKEASYRIETVNGVKYLVSEITSQEAGNFYYVYRYSTVHDKTATALTLQAEAKPDDKAISYFKEAVASMEHKEVKASLTQNAYFTELTSTLIGIVLVVGILGIILFLFIRADNKSHRR